MINYGSIGNKRTSNVMDVLYIVNLLITIDYANYSI